MVNFPALAEEEDILGRQPGEALWPEVFTRERLEKVRDSHTNYYWHALYQQRPHAEGSAEWPDDYFGRDIWFDDWPERPQIKIVALDPSKGVESKHGDYSAFVMLAIGEGHLWVDADLEIRNTSIIAETAIEIQRTFRADAFGIETNQFQQLLADEITRRAQALAMPMPVWTYENYVKKVVRIRRLTPYLAKKQIRFKANSKGARLLVEQLRDFPNADHDDGPDALDQAIQLAGNVWGHAQDYVEEFMIA